MNKQEAIEIIEQSKIKIANRERVIFKAGEIIGGCVQVDYVPLEVVVNTIDQIHEPQKVVVPKFIADSIEYCKNKEGYGLLRAMDYCDEYNDTGEWLEHNQETFALAWLFGYEIEQEKLYTVEIPNPNATHDDVYILGRTLSGSIAIWRSIGRNGNKNYDSDFQLTESEIKQDFEWAWQWAKPVEVE
ncbi:DUF1642 domain-containing protein [Streptococcus suis]|uniref:DUF1642 domain-containing protein n=1 Tax=Streptococcus suis TaxID=1307 RepID=UPI0003F8DD8E|nr:DUF1642 domain-containing protein [Streptococcus suis]